MSDEISLSPDLQRGLDCLESAYRGGRLDIDAKNAVADFIHRELRIRGAETRALESLRAKPQDTVKVELTRDELRVLKEHFEGGIKYDGGGRRERDWTVFESEHTIRNKLRIAQLTLNPPAEKQHQTQELKPSRGLRM